MGQPRRTVAMCVMLVGVASAACGSDDGGVTATSDASTGDGEIADGAADARASDATTNDVATNDAATNDAANDATVDATTPDAANDATADATTPDAATDATADATNDATASDAAIADVGVNDADAGLNDADAGASEAGASDAGAVDAAPDASSNDAGAVTYAYIAGPTGVAGYVVTSSGVLNPIDMDPAPGIQFAPIGQAVGALQATSIAAHPSGKFLYVNNYDNGTVGGYTIDHATGVLTRIDASPSPGIQDFGGGGPGTSFVAADPLGRLLYVANYTTSRLSSYAINATTGALTFVASTSLTGQSLAIVVDPQARYLAVTGRQYVLTMCTLDPVTGFPTPIDADVTTSGRQDYTIGFDTVAAAIDATGTRLYAPSLSSYLFSSFTVVPTTAVATALYAPLSEPFARAPAGIAIHPSGAYAYLANYLDQVIEPWSIDSTGRPTQVMPTYGTSRPNRAIAFDPTGKYLYAGNDNGLVFMYAYTGTNGALSPLGTVASPSEAATFAFVH